MSLNNIISDLRTTGPNPDGTYPVTRTAAGARVNGRYTPGVVTVINIVAGIEAVTGRELKDLPEGQRADEVIKIFTEVPLITVRTGFEPDVIGYVPPGLAAVEPWTVISCTVCEGFGEVHYESTACRAPSPAGSVP